LRVLDHEDAFDNTEGHPPNPLQRGKGSVVGSVFPPFEGGQGAVKMISKDSISTSELFNFVSVININEIWPIHKLIPEMF
jgi:hypothetical protein